MLSRGWSRGSLRARLADEGGKFLQLHKFLAMFDERCGTHRRRRRRSLETPQDERRRHPRHPYADSGARNPYPDSGDLARSRRSSSVDRWDERIAQSSFASPGFVPPERFATPGQAASEGERFASFASFASR